MICVHTQVPENLLSAAPMWRQSNQEVEGYTQRMNKSKPSYTQESTHTHTQLSYARARHTTVRVSLSGRWCLKIKRRKTRTCRAMSLIFVRSCPEYTPNPSVCVCVRVLLQGPSAVQSTLQVFSQVISTQEQETHTSASLSHTIKSYVFGQVFLCRNKTLRK